MDPYATRGPLKSFVYHNEFSCYYSKLILVGILVICFSSKKYEILQKTNKENKELQNRRTIIIYISIQSLCVHLLIRYDNYYIRCHNYIFFLHQQSIDYDVCHIVSHNKSFVHQLAYSTKRKALNGNNRTQKNYIFTVNNANKQYRNLYIIRSIVKHIMCRDKNI